MKRDLHSQPTGWVRVTPDTVVRRLPNGQLHSFQVEDCKESLRAAEEMRKETRMKASMTHTKDGAWNCVASLPKTVHREMLEKCGNDPEKQNMFLRDHPQHLTQTPREAGLPGKTIYSYPKRMRPGT